MQQLLKHNRYCVALIAAAMLLFSSFAARAFEARVLSGFGDIEGRVGAHTGVDIAAPYRSPVLAAAPGVVYATNGPIVVIWHIAAGSFTVYAHLARSDVAAGDHVDRGQQIGSVGTSGSNMRGDPYLHFELNTDGEPHTDGNTALSKDPMKYIVGCFDPKADYPEDKLVLTMPVACDTLAR